MEKQVIKEEDKKDELELDVKPVKVEFDELQKEHVNKVIQDRLGRQKTALETQFEERLQSELVKLRAELTPPKKEEKKDKDDPVEMAKEQARQFIEEERRKATTAALKQKEAEEKVKKLEEDFAKVRKQDAMRKAMANSGYQFHSPEEVLMLTERFIETASDGTYIVRDENGKVRENSSLDTMSMEEYYADFGKVRP